MELLTGHSLRIRTELGVTHHVFKQLLLKMEAMGCKASTFVTLEEQLAIFLYIAVTGNTIRHTGERFQRANDTISKYERYLFYYYQPTNPLIRYYKTTLKFFSGGQFYHKYIVLPDKAAPIPNKILNNPKFWHFRGALGALDGCHIVCTPPTGEHRVYHNRKGFASHNCLFVCNFSFKCVYVLTGAEGSATDTRVWDFATSERGGFRVPQGRYYLGDAGYPNCAGIVVPYRYTRYHVLEWGSTAVRYVSQYSKNPFNRD